MNSIIDFLNKNKEWLFSGLGLSVIVLIYYGIRWFLSFRKIDNKNSDDLVKIALAPNQEISRNQSINIINNNRLLPNITPPQIFEAIESAPLLQQ